MQLEELQLLDKVSSSVLRKCVINSLENIHTDVRDQRVNTVIFHVLKHP